MRNIIVGVIIMVFCITCLTGCVISEYLANKSEDYIKEINQLSGQKEALQAESEKLINKLKDKSLKPKEAAEIAVKISIVANELAKTVGEIADKRETERSKGIPLWYSLLKFALGVGTAIGGVWAIPGRYLRLAEAKKK